MIGILLAGGRGTRLWPITVSTNKHLLPVYDKPMIYYSLTTLMMTGAQRIVLITNPADISAFENLLGDGSNWGLEISYHSQEEPKGIGDAFRLVPDDLRSQPACLVLGDNLLYGMGLGTSLSQTFSGSGSQIFSYQVSNPEDYGVIEIDSKGDIASLAEKPVSPKSNLAIPGIYFFDQSVYQKFGNLKESTRGEYEIIDILKMYLSESALSVSHLERGTAWLDTGNPENLISAGEFVKVIESRQGMKIGCPEEVSLRMGFVSKAEFLLNLANIPEGSYKSYLNKI
jgi:glucose-1-phosphate thymidylyltransferase